MVVEIILLLIILLIFLYIFVGVLRNNNINNISQKRIFVNLVLWILLWVISILLTNIFFKELKWALLFSKLSFATSSIITLLYLLFVLQYMKNNWLPKMLKILGIITTFFLFVISFTDKILTRVYILENGLVSERGTLYNFFAVYTGATFLISAMLFYLAYRNQEKKILKTQMLYILIGSGLSIASSYITNLVFPVFGFKEIRAIGPLGLSFFIVGTYYAIIRYRFISSKLIFSKLIYMLTISVFPYSIFHLVIFLQNTIWGSVYDTGALLSGYLYSIAFVNLFLVLSNKLNINLRRLITRETDLNEQKIGLTQQFEALLDIKEISTKIIKVINKAFNTEADFIIMEDKNEYVSSFNNGLKVEIKEFLDKLDEELIIGDELIYRKENYEILRVLKDIGMEVLVPVKLSKDVTWKSFIFIGQKGDATSFSIQDIEFLKFLSSLASVSIQRAYLHQKVINYNADLKDQVAKQTSKIQAQLKQLQDAREKERNMIDIMGHELRTPATIANLNADLLAKYWRELLPYIKHPQKTAEEIEDRYIKYMARLKEGIVREIKLINVLLASAKIDGGKIVLNKEAVDISNVIQTSIHAHERDAKIKGLSLRYANAEDESNIEKEIDAQDLDIIGDFGIPKIYADKTRIFEVVDNLITNAIKYTEEGEVTVSVESDEEKVEVTVKDTGVGISEADLKKIGQKFYRVGQYTDNGDDEDTDTVSAQKGNGKYKLVRPGGTGLGLYVAFGLVKEHGGQVKIKSKLGVGSEFSFSIGIYKREYKRAGSGDNGSKDMFKKFGLGKK